MTALERIVRTVRWALGPFRDPVVRRLSPAYTWTLDRLYGEKGMPRCVGGSDVFRVRARYRAIFCDIVEPEVYNWLRAFVKPGMTIMDLGANVGRYTLMMASWVGENGKVIAFEPAPESSAALEDHLHLNQLRSRVIIEKCAVGSKEGTVDFFADQYSGENSLRTNRKQVGQGRIISVPVTTIDTYCGRHQLIPHLLKVDIEGFEFEAFEGGRKTIEQHRPVLMVEMHPMYWEDIGWSADRARKFFDELGYRAEVIQGEGDPFEVYGHVAFWPRERSAK